MKSLSLAMLPILFSLAPTVPAHDGALGLTCDQILAMKPDKWTAYYAEKSGDSSENGKDNASQVYAACLGARNEVRFARLQKPDRERLAEYRRLMVRFRELEVQVASGYAGGGERFPHAEARAALDDELLMAKLIKWSSRPIAQETLSKRLRIMDLIGWVRKRLGENGVIPWEQRREMSDRGLDWRSILATNVKAMVNYDTILPILPRHRQDECIAVLEYYYSWLTRFDQAERG
ncbi:MAG: hypothetical protein IH851_13680 [Armatimonadetes bacterium]|nr:hypothetical protein [Armatimonadota bacterium]